MATTQLMRTTLFAIITIWAIETTSFSVWAHESKSIYEALESHGLPMGLLPKGVKNYTLDEEGRFQVYLDQACNAKFESELHYDLSISGQLIIGQIRNLTGIQAQDLFLWFPVKGIRVDIPSSGVIYFDVGVVFKQFSLSLFETPPDCVAASHPPVKYGATINTPLLDVLAKKLAGVLQYPFNLGESGRESM